MLPLVLLICVCSLVESWALTNNKAALTNDIIHFSHELETWLDVQTQPCDDFFGYICPRSLNATKQSRYERQLQHEQIKFKAFLEESNDEELLDAELKLKQFYNSCRNARSMEQLKSTLMYRSVGGWPAIDDSVPSLRKRHNTTWLQVLSVFHETGIPYFFRTTIELISNKRTVKIQPDNILHFTLRKFEQLAGEIMRENDIEAGRARLVALEILNFERSSRDIMKMSVSEKEKLQFSYAEFKLLPFGSVSSLDWDGYFRKVMGKPLKATDLVIVTDMPKLVKYFELLQNTTLTRFLNWLWIDYLMDKTKDDCKKLSDKYFGNVYQHVIQRAGIDKVQMAHMYSVLGQQYEQLLVQSPWIDEMTQQNSKLFLDRIMHLTLNGDAKLDDDYQLLTITQRNFYRNLEKLQRFKAQQVQIENGADKSLAGRTLLVTQRAEEFMQTLAILNTIIPPELNLTVPLNYMLLGEYFAETMIGAAYDTPGAWRSTDSDKNFEDFVTCVQIQQSDKQKHYNSNNLLLKLLARKQSWQAYQLWLQQDEQFVKHLNRMLSVGKLQLNMDKLYFIAAHLMDCYLNITELHRHFLNMAVKQSSEFEQTFKCRKGDSLFTDKKCLVLQEN